MVPAEPALPPQRSAAESSDSPFTPSATGRLEQAPGKAVKGAPPARIPANTVVACAFWRAWPYHPYAGGEAGPGCLLSVCFP